MEFITELYQFLFMSSIVFIVYVLGGLIMKTYGRFILKADTVFVLTKIEKIMLWVSIALFFTYIFK